jgi:hypothetical protein
VPPSPTVVFFSANPASLTQLDLEGEIRSIEAELATEGVADALRFLPRHAANPDDLQRVMLHERPVVVQFSGHGRGTEGHGGRGEGTREMVDDDDAAAPRRPTGIMLHGVGSADVAVVSGKALAHLFSALGGGVRLVFLNACHSVEQADALLEHVDFVVGIDGAILDSAAKLFAVAFYRALASGRTLQVAYALGVNALMLHGLHTEVPRPVLRAREGEDPRRFRLVPALPHADGSLWDAFLSYTRNDRRVTSEMASALLDHGIRVYFNEWEEKDGDVTVLRESDAIEKSVHGIMVMSTKSMDDRWVRQMYASLVTKAVEDGQRLIPVLVGEDEIKLPPFLRIRKPVDLRDKTPDEYRQAIRSMARAVRAQ